MPSELKNTVKSGLVRTGGSDNMKSAVQAGREMAKMLFNPTMRRHAGKVIRNRRRDVRLNIRTYGTSQKYKRDFLFGADREIAKRRKKP